MDAWIQSSSGLTEREDERSVLASAMGFKLHSCRGLCERVASRVSLCGSDGAVAAGNDGDDLRDHRATALGRWVVRHHPAIEPQTKPGTTWRYGMAVG